MSAARRPTRPAAGAPNVQSMRRAGSTAGSVTDDDDRRQPTKQLNNTGPLGWRRASNKYFATLATFAVLMPQNRPVEYGTVELYAAVLVLEVLSRPSSILTS